MVKVELYGLFRLDTGIKSLEADVAAVKDLYPILLDEARRLNPKTKITAKDIDGCIVVINGKQSNKKASLKDGDKVMLLSPVWGG